LDDNENNKKSEIITNNYIKFYSLATNEYITAMRLMNEVYGIIITSKYVCVVSIYKSFLFY
jgi:hypothetical protein